MRRPFEIKRILIPTDFSETAGLALEHGTFMAKLSKAEIILLHVIESYSFASTITSAFSTKQIEYEKKLGSSSDEKLKQLAEQIHRNISMPVSYETVKGTIHKSIIDVAKDKNVDIIFMGTHGTGGIKENIIGSNAYKTAHQSTVPVITVQAHSRKIGFHNIILPIDNSHASRQKVPIALALAKYYKSKIHIVGLNTLSDPDLKMRFPIKVDQVKDFVEEHGVPYTAKILEGSRLTTPLMDCATQANADLIIVMSDQEGSTAKQLVNHTKVPIMCIHPEEADPEKISLGY